MTGVSPAPREGGASAMMPRWLAGVALLLMAVLLILLFERAVGWGEIVAKTVTYPDQVDYGEGIIWQQTDLILRGDGYKEITRLPHIVFHYPPVFHLVSGLLAESFGIDQLAGGRIVSSLSTVGILFLIGLIVYRATPEGGPARLFCAGIASLIAPNFGPIAAWSATDRVDMLAIFLTLLGASFALGLINQRHNAVIAALFFVLAIFTKQTMVAAPIAAFVVLLFVRPRAAWMGLGAAAVFGGAGILVLQSMTNGGFLEHVVGYNINRFRLENGIFILVLLVAHGTFAVLASASAISIVSRFGRQRIESLGHATLRQSISASHVLQLELFSVCYFLLTTLFLVTVLKSGANYNYLIEWMAACCVQIGLFLRRPVILAFTTLGNWAAGKLDVGNNGSVIEQTLFLPILVLLIVQVGFVPVPKIPKAIAEMPDAQQFPMLTDMIRRSSKPVISDNMVAVKKAGKELFLEPAIIAELTATGGWDESELLLQIMNQKFGFIVVEESKNDRYFDIRYSPAVRAAIKLYYPRTEKLARHLLHFPRY